MGWGFFSLRKILTHFPGTHNQDTKTAFPHIVISAIFSSMQTHTHTTIVQKFYLNSHWNEIHNVSQWGKGSVCNLSWVFLSLFILMLPMASGPQHSQKSASVHILIYLTLKCFIFTQVMAFIGSYTSCRFARKSQGSEEKVRITWTQVRQRHFFKSGSTGRILILGATQALPLRSIWCVYTAPQDSIQQGTQRNRFIPLTVHEKWKEKARTEYVGMDGTFPMFSISSLLQISLMI